MIVQIESSILIYKSYSERSKTIKTARDKNYIDC